MYRKLTIIVALLFACTFSSQAQFGHLLKKAKEKVEHAITKEDSSTSHGAIKPADQPEKNQQKQPQGVDQPEESANPKPIDFPHTGQSVKAMHAVIAPVIDGDIKKILATDIGQYTITVARRQGFEGSDKEIFRQLLDLKNYQKMQEINDIVKKKFARSGDVKPKSAPGAANPAWGNISAPSLFFDMMIGKFDLWMTDRYIKTASKHDHATYADAFGVNAASITDVQQRKTYILSSVFGVNYTKIKPLDSLGTANPNGLSGASLILPIVKKQFLGIKGVKVEPGTAGMFGSYHAVSEKLIIPVQPFLDKQSGRQNKSLLYLHDILSGKHDFEANNGQGNWDPSYKIVYEYYFTHDFDQYLPEGIKNFESTDALEKGLCVGGAIEDENGNSAIYRIIDVKTDQDIDSGQFHIPEDYPEMTDKELHQAIRKKMGLDMKNNLMKELKDQVQGDNQ